MDTSDHVMEVTDLRRVYEGGFEAVRGVTFHVDRGEIFALLGTNGAGKTSTVELLEGLAPPSGGRVRVLGHDPYTERAAVRPRTGVMLQEGGLPSELTVGETARMWAGCVSGARPVREALALVGLERRTDVRVKQLSGGERRRLDLALALLGRPEVLFLDEPTTGLDPEARNEFHDLVRGLANESTTVLLTTHDLAEAEKLADRILILAGGRIVADGSAEELSRRISAEATVRWTRDGQPYEESTAEPTRFVRRLFEEYGDAIGGLEVRRASLEDTYLTMVRELEAGKVPGEQAAHAFGSREEAR